MHLRYFGKLFLYNIGNTASPNTYTPQQNDVSERKNRSIMEMTRCLLHEKELPKKWWVEAALTLQFFVE